MNLKRLFVRLLVIVVITALLVPSFITRIQNENKNKDVVLALNYSQFASSLSEKKLDKLLETCKDDGVTTVYVGEESLNSLASRSEITVLLFSEVKRLIDEESREITKILEEDKNVTLKSTIIILKNDEMKEFFNEWIPQKYLKKEYTTITTSQDSLVYVLYDQIYSFGHTPIGFNEKVIAKAKEKGHHIVLAMMATDNKNVGYINKLDELIKKYDIEFLNIKKNGSPLVKKSKKTVEGLCKLIENNNLNLVVTENSDQLSNQKPFGYNDYIKSANGKILRSYETGGDLFDDKKPVQSRYFKMLNSVIDRNARLVVINSIYNQEGTDEDKAYMSIEATGMLKDKLTSFGYNTESYNTQFENYNLAGKKAAALSLVIIILMWLTMVEFLYRKPCEKLAVAAYVMIIPAVIVTMMLPGGLVELYPSLFAVTAPCFCITMALMSAELLREKLKNIWLFISVIAITLISVGLCGIVQSALLSGLDYYINTLIFRGIKLSLMLPIIYSVVCAFVLYTNKDGLVKKIVKFIKAEIKVWWIIVAAVAGFVFMTYVRRSGNVSSISTLEALMRNTITNIMEARPRTKEFLVGWPCLMLFIYYLKNTPYNLLKSAFLIGSSILFASCINSFCHVFTDTTTIYMRVVNGALIGISIGLIALIGNAILLKIVKKLIEVGKKNGILSD
ncbi:MAG: hypothetical protein IKA17_00355 [Clostridia bacterium]|nr:hypothetical protein [Clostridia bacterium]